MNLKVFIVSLLLIILSACSFAPSNSTPTQAPSTPASPETSSAYPVPTERPQTPIYPYPLPPTITPVSVDTAEPTIEIGESSGAIRGILLDKEGQPIAGLYVFLATITDNPAGPIISFLLESDKGFTNAAGQFVIDNVPAGVYSLAIWTPAVNFLIPAPNGEEGSAIRVEVRNGQITELGEIRIKRP
ncbi:hypothetical protein [Chloroflexus sp.]|uniref:hypothetical protein n=1 Tax=Chloroflexus sp. TaxID=1904827 RepID=UPI00404A23FF